MVSFVSEAISSGPYVKIVKAFCATLETMLPVFTPPNSLSFVQPQRWAVLAWEQAKASSIYC